MKALIVSGAGVVAVEEIDEPRAADGEALVAPRLNGICGTDLELIDGTIDPAYVRLPLVLGHEWVGQLADDVDGIGTRGDHVVVEGIIPCGACADCRRGDTNRCAVYDEIGFTRPGAIAELIAVPTTLIHRLDPSVELDDAVFVEPMSVVWRALTRIALEPGLRIAVIGDGTIAMLVAHMVQLFAPASVVMVGRREEQRALATRAGATEFTISTPEGRFDVVIEAAGTGESASTALAMADRGAMVILLGLAPHGTTIDLAPDELVNNDQILQGSFSYTRSAWAQVVSRVNAGELRPSFLITHRFELSSALDAVATLRGAIGAHEARGKVVIEVTPR